MADYIRKGGQLVIATGKQPTSTPPRWGIGLYRVTKSAGTQVLIGFLGQDTKTGTTAPDETKHPTLGLEFFTPAGTEQVFLVDTRGLVIPRGGGSSAAFLALTRTDLSTSSFEYSTWNPATTTTFQVGTAIEVNPTTHTKVKLTGAGAYIIDYVPTVHLTSTNVTAAVKWQGVVTARVGTTTNFYQDAVTWQLSRWRTGFTFTTHGFNVSLPTRTLSYVAWVGAGSGTPVVTLTFYLTLKLKALTGHGTGTPKIVTNSLTIARV